MKVSSYLKKYQSLSPHGYPRSAVGPDTLCLLASIANSRVFTKGNPGHPGAQSLSLSASPPNPAAADASFVAAIPSTQVVYFFFEETASEFEFFDKLHTSRVARVCKVGRLGGEAGVTVEEPIGRWQRRG